MQESELDIQIPVGFKDGEEWKVRGEGHVSYDGKSFSDIVVKALLQVPQGFSLENDGAKLVFTMALDIEDILRIATTSVNTTSANDTFVETPLHEKHKVSSCFDLFSP